MILRRIAAAFRRQDWFTVSVETMIVVLGVFLGLQVNNWNSERQLRQQEQDLLRVLADDFKSNIGYFDQNIAFDKSSVEACDQILALMEKGQEWTIESGTKMGKCRDWTSPFVKSYGFDTLRAVGLDILTDPSLRRRVSELYNLTYATLKDDRDKAFWVYHQAVIVPTFARYLVYPAEHNGYDQIDRFLMPQDYEALKASTEFRSVILGKRAYQVWSIQSQINAQGATQAVLNDIEAQLQ